jgi:hypothetical protein
MVKQPGYLTRVLSSAERWPDEIVSACNPKPLFLFYSKLMKQFLLSILVIFIFSCKDKTPAGTNSSDSTPTSKPVVKNQGTNSYADIDVSPMDMSYYPVEYPKLEMNGSVHGSAVMRVIYSRPHKEGRVIFGGLQKYGSYWRLGANEGSEIEFFKPVTIQQKKVDAGRYIIYCIPYENKWTIVLNKNLFTWGLKVDTTKDLVRFDIPVKKIPTVEYFSMVFQPAGTGADLVMAWMILKQGFLLTSDLEFVFSLLTFNSCVALQALYRLFQNITWAM